MTTRGWSASKQFGGLQFLLFGLFYVVAGILLLGGAIRYACRHG